MTNKILFATSEGTDGVVHSVPPRPWTGNVFKCRTVLHVQRSNGWFHTHLKTRIIIIRISSSLQAGLVLC